MAKVIVNGKVVKPATKVKLFLEKPATEIQKLIRKKREEVDERSSDDNR